MNWEEKCYALKALGDIGLRMRKPGDWYVDHRGVDCIEVGRNGMLVGRFGNGPTPQAALENHWDRLNDESVARIVINAYGKLRREVRWNGYMWDDLTPMGGE